MVKYKESIRCAHLIGAVIDVAAVVVDIVRYLMCERVSCVFVFYYESWTGQVVDEYK
jgi:hypothetical protein